MFKKYFFDVVIWILIAAWCGMIFGLSGENDDQSGDRSEDVCRVIAGIVISDYEELTPLRQNEIIENMQFYVRKAAHFTVYLVLGAMLCTAFRRLSAKKRVPIAVLLSAVYAATDEFHQSFVSGRDGNPFDVLLDTCGALTGTLLCSFIITIVYSRLQTSAPGK